MPKSPSNLGENEIIINDELVYLVNFVFLKKIEGDPVYDWNRLI